MGSRDIKLFLIKVMILLVVPAVIYINVLNKVDYYCFYENGVYVACVNDKEEVREAFNQVKGDINKRFGATIDKSNNISFKKSSENVVSEYTLNELKESIVKNLNLNVTAFRFVIGKNSIGYIANKEEGKQILEKVADRYIDIGKIDKSDIVSISIDTNSEYIEEKTSVSNVLPTDEVVNKIIETDKDSEDPLVKVEVKTKDKTMIDVEPATIINSSKDLFIGESKIDKGTNGKNEVEEEGTYINGKKINTEKLGEKVVVKPIDTVIHTGTKNPIPSGIAFLSRPSRGNISSSFGARWGEVHHGIDIASNVGDPIGAALDGVVKETSYNSIYGNMIVVDHGGGIETIYGHCSKVLVKPGQKIKRGDTIGKVGTTGRSTGPHLHFELRVNGTAINPNKYIK
ncbi:peptidoglycan DD-metalloendopeptidase family protein [Clostridium sp. YIM B02505]|uniref:Peptidoglycan DD-metalloendopeptidase family protein n=1 Tax=Clostridium yunnanense TaxID=2800325 RepID=A0ABS1ENN7_9CLOT|nr:peptidoglycan DD-metalloendopeptidase family protein [Clostridium yunnanense]MBK1810883.1 peptidoglycan DD-metalloendopeptidase family protein [Clostridium yunnanense]